MRELIDNSKHFRCDLPLPKKGRSNQELIVYKCFHSGLNVTLTQGQTVMFLAYFYCPYTQPNLSPHLHESKNLSDFVLHIVTLTFR